MGDANEYLKLQEIADKYRVNQMTVRRWIKAGHLPAMKVGKQYRIKQSDVDAFLAQEPQGDNLTAPFVTALAFARPAPIASRTGLQVKQRWV
jgi:excisionase family DNA binding protein